MKYFVTLVYIKTDGTYTEEEGAFDRSTAMHNDFNSAKSAYHQAINVAIDKKTGEDYKYSSSIVFMYDSKGTIHYKDVWNR